MSEVLNNYKCNKSKHGKSKMQDKQKIIGSIQMIKQVVNVNTSRMSIFDICIVERELSECQTLLQLSRIRFIDIDSKRKKCEERLMKILDSKQSITSKQMFFEKLKYIQMRSPIANSNQLLCKHCNTSVDKPVILFGCVVIIEFGNKHYSCTDKHSFMFVHCVP